MGKTLDELMSDINLLKLILKNYWERKEIKIFYLRFLSGIMSLRKNLWKCLRKY